jgi:hypothetical protein
VGPQELAGGQVAPHISGTRRVKAQALGVQNSEARVRE